MKPHLDPDVARRVANLRLRAQHTVVGVLSGMHKSPHRGASAVFVEHRDYRPGDDPRRLDWRVFARRDRPVTKHFEQETQLSAMLVLDRSGSMGFGPAERGQPKDEYAATVLAAMGLILLRQGDAVGACTLHHELLELVPARRGPAHLQDLLRALCVAPEKGSPTSLRPALQQVAERLGRRGVVALASDLLDLSEDALASLSLLKAAGHDLYVFQILHPDEIEFPFEEPARFEGLEQEASLPADPSALRDAYQRELQAFLEGCRTRTAALGARYTLARTDTPAERVLATALRQSAWG